MRLSKIQERVRHVNGLRLSNRVFNMYESHDDYKSELRQLVASQNRLDAHTVLVFTANACFEKLCHPTKLIGGSDEFTQRCVEDRVRCAEERFDSIIKETCTHCGTTIPVKEPERVASEIPFILPDSVRFIHTSNDHVVEQRGRYEASVFIPAQSGQALYWGHPGLKRTAKTCCLLNHVYISSLSRETTTDFSCLFKWFIGRPNLSETTTIQDINEVPIYVFLIL